MRFQSSGKFSQGVADVDPTVSPGTISESHVLRLPDLKEKPSALYLALIGAGAETLTLDLFSLVDETNAVPDPEDLTASRYVQSTHTWVEFAAGVVVANGKLEIHTADLPKGGVVYAQRKSDSIAAGQTRVLTAAWG